MSHNNTNTRLILFDMDNTLVTVSRWHEQSILETLLRVYGVDATQFIPRCTRGGNTQASAMRTICLSAGLEEELIESRLAEAEKVLSATAIEILPDDLRPYILGGVLPLLQSLQDSGHPLGLVTGTVSPTTRAILERTDLRRFFPVCACGEEQRTRVDLLHLLVERASEFYELARAGVQLVVVGDSPRDIQAGQAVGAWTVAVATGACSATQLGEVSPDVTLPNFEDWSMAREALLNGRPSR